LAQWCATTGGSLAWVADNPELTIDFSSDHLLGFDDTDLLESPEVLDPITSILLHMANSLIDGRRFMYFMAEFWKRLELPACTDFAVNKQYTIRKQNGFGVFDTQSPAQILKTPHVAAMVEQSATQIFLPNPRASYDDYVKGFSLTKAEFETIKSFEPDSRQMLIKQGHGTAIVTLDLGGLGEYLNILSSSTDNLAVLDEIRAEVGDDPEIWLPIFKEKMQLRKAMEKEKSLRKQ
jgi:type IV secretion system protein VirB4